MNTHAHPPGRHVGRGAALSPPNRFERVHAEYDPEHEPAIAESLAPAKDSPGDLPRLPTVLLPDAAKTVIRENNSPDIPFRFSINPYRGCEHGCAYCYARPTHETLGMNAGLDFETKILVKHEAARLLRDELNRPGWRGETIAISGVTDPYQPAERTQRVTRSILEVLAEARQPLGLITKNGLVLRDLDLLGPMAERNLVQVNLSVTTLDAELARRLEPRTSTPAARLRAIGELAAAGVPVRAMLAPVIPGLNDSELPALMKAVAAAGARAAAFTLLRLPLAVAPIFQAWLAEHAPEKRDRVLGLIRATRGGQLSDSRFGHRMRGHGSYAEGISRTFRVFARRHGLDRSLAPLDGTHFRPPRSASGQGTLF